MDNFAGISLSLNRRQIFCHFFYTQLYREHFYAYTLKPGFPTVNVKGADCKERMSSNTRHCKQRVDFFTLMRGCPITRTRLSYRCEKSKYIEAKTRLAVASAKAEKKNPLGTTDPQRLPRTFHRRSACIGDNCSTGLVAKGSQSKIDCMDSNESRPS